MRKVINCGHRGAMAQAPENTIKSFRRAAECGADMIELDVFLTSDNVPVIVHDAVLHTKPRGGDVRRMRWEELRDLRFHGEPIPTLQEAVDLCREKNMLINIEIKDPRAVHLVAETVRNNNLYNECQVSNFRIDILRKVKSIDSRIPTGYLSVPLLHWRQLRLAAASGCQSVNPLYACATERFVRAARSIGVQVHVWTVNEPDKMRRMIRANVDCIITNVPDVLTRVKKEMGVE